MTGYWDKGREWDAEPAEPARKTGIKIVFNRLLNGWYVVRGPHQTPLAGRFNTKEEAQAYLRAVRNPPSYRATR